MRVAITFNYRFLERRIQSCGDPGPVADRKLLIDGTGVAFMDHSIRHQIVSLKYGRYSVTVGAAVEMATNG